MPGRNQFRRNPENRQLVRCVLIITGLLLMAMGPADVAAADGREAFRVENLPGLSGAPGFDQYAGYLTVDRELGDHLFFWLFESQSSPQNDPLLIWLSGGPGCSSIAAMFEENGPFHFDQQGKEIRLKANPFSWNSRANIIYLDQPIGTGMSYSESETYAKNQYEVSRQFYAFLKAFYAVFPDMQKNPLFIVGESYAGHMIPGIADYIFDQDGQPGAIQVNLKGLAVGNGWIDPQHQRKVMPEVFYAASLITAEQRDEAVKLFQWAVENDGVPEMDNYGPGPGPTGYKFPAIEPPKPFKGLKIPSRLKKDEAVMELKAVLDPYKGKSLNQSLSLKDFIRIIDIFGKGGEPVRELLPTEVSVVFLDHSYAHLVFQFFLERLVSYTEHNGNYVNLMNALNYGPTIFVGLPTQWPEGDALFEAYMNLPGVREALNTESYPHPKCQACNPMVSYVFNYLNSEFQKSFLFLYPRVMNRIPVLFYNGQNDLICSAMATREFLLKIARDPYAFYFPGKETYSDAPYVPWAVKITEGPKKGEAIRHGYYRRAGNLHYLNVLNASHMVPLSKPQAAQILINDFIHHGKIITD